MFKATTIKDIAKALSLSTSTVSRALRDSYQISEETKKRVTDYASLLNYHSNPIALSLKNKRSYSIGVMVSDVANSFFSQTINGIESVAYEKGYHVIISQSHDSYEREVINIQHLANRSVDGLLISMSAQTTDYGHIKQLHDNGLPIVFFDRIVENIPTFMVTTDNFKAAYQATEIFIKKGYKRIAHLANAPQLSITIQRINGYKEALTHYNIEFDENLVRYCYEAGRNMVEVETAINHFLESDNKPDAILIASDRLSTASLRALDKLQHPADMAIIGFSNSDVIDLLTPKISFVRQRAFEMGKIAIEMLIRLIESKYPVTEFETKLLDADVFWRS
jgi:LacI family transcriptional regulator